MYFYSGKAYVLPGFLNNYFFYIYTFFLLLKCIGCTEHNDFISTERTQRATPRSRIVTRQQIHNLQDGADLYEAIQNASDPGYMEVTVDPTRPILKCSWNNLQFSTSC